MIQAAQITQQQLPGQPGLTFPPADAPEFKEAMVRNQETVARIEYTVNEALVPITAVAKLRDRETSRRWQAHYDLIRGRLLAMKIRCFEYNTACARMKKDAPKFKDPKSNAWRLVPTEEILSGDKVASRRQGGQGPPEAGRRRPPQHPLGPARPARAEGPVRLQVGRDQRPAPARSGTRPTAAAKKKAAMKKDAKARGSPQDLTAPPAPPGKTGRSRANLGCPTRPRVRRQSSRSPALGRTPHRDPSARRRPAGIPGPWDLGTKRHGFARIRIRRRATGSTSLVDDPEPGPARAPVDPDAAPTDEIAQRPGRRGGAPAAARAAGRRARPARGRRPRPRRRRGRAQAPPEASGRPEAMGRPGLGRLGPDPRRASSAAWPRWRPPRARSSGGSPTSTPPWAGPRPPRS